MAKQEIKVFGDKICCSICLDLLKEPVTLPCGHNYCMNCIKGYWDGEDQKHTHSCPQCRQTFIPRPALGKNTMLAELVEEMKKTGLQAAPADHCYAGPGDVSCEVCTGRKLKAIKSCLQCVVSYCEQHLQPHYNVAALKKHKLVSPSENLLENMCTNHNEVMKIFCRTDQKCICYLCSIDEHKDHCIVSAATEKNERQKELKLCREKIHQKIKDREADVMVFQQRMEAINYSADEAVRDSEKIFSELMLLIEKRSSDIKQQIRSQQETEVNRTRKLLQQVQQELSELKRKDVQLEELSHTEDLIRFLHTFPSLSYICESTLYKAPRITLPPMAYFKDVVGAVSEMKDELQRMLSDRWQKSSQTVTNLQSLDPLTLNSDSESEATPFPPSPPPPLSRFRSYSPPPPLSRFPSPPIPLSRFRSYSPPPPPPLSRFRSYSPPPPPPPPLSRFPSPPIPLSRFRSPSPPPPLSRFRSPSPPPPLSRFRFRSHSPPPPLSRFPSPPPPPPLSRFRSSSRPLAPP